MTLIAGLKRRCPPTAEHWRGRTPSNRRKVPRPGATSTAAWS